MKNVNTKGFTLIELLAVITIMGILMIVAIPAVTRTIENSRKDTFIDTVKQYANGAKNMWAADNLSCTISDGDDTTDDPSYTSSAVPVGEYYIRVDSSDSSTPQLLEQGGKSPWGNRDMKGYIRVDVDDVALVGKDGISDTEDDVITRKVTYIPFISDGIHGVNLKKDEVFGVLWADRDDLVEADNLKRSDITMSEMVYLNVNIGDSFCVES